MAAYAALTSLNNLIHQIQHHPFLPISIDKQQLKSLAEDASFLLQFLETYQSPVSDADETDPLEMRIADAAHAAEDVIESHIIDAIKLGRSKMAAYAALTSLNNLIHQIQHHPSPPIFINKQQLQLQSLSENASFLLQFLETYQSPVSDADETDPLEMRIADAAFAAADVVDRCTSHIVSYITATSTGLTISVDYFGRYINTLSPRLRKKEVMKDTYTVKPQLQRNISASSGEVLLEVLDKLTGEEQRRQIIPIVGMGGIGKTTLARHVYAHPLIKEKFDVCVWATISQKYDTKEILCDLLSQANKKSKDQLSNMSRQELESELYKHLFGRRFLIVMDDMWSIDAWEKMERFFPDNGNRSRIVVTTRLSALGFQLNNGYCLRMKFLDDDSSWKLFLKTVFGEESCPAELEEIGKKIVETCKGLPLSIAVMGGLLKNLEHVQECWESVRKNSSSVGNSENEDFCLKILKMSYNHLPVYLKPCFMYMGVFEEDRPVRVSTLVKLWVSEGFLKPSSGKSLEMTAKEYLNDLVDRNLVLVHELGSTGNIKYCKLHDLLRDLCWREAGKEGFYNVMGQHKFQSRRQRCVVIRGSTWKEEKVDVALRSMPLARSFLCDSNEDVPLPELRLLRILKAYDTSGSRDYRFDDLFGYVNSRYLAVGVHWESQLSSSVGLLWNLQTFIVFHSVGVTAPDEFWNLSQLRHVEFHKGVLTLSRSRGHVVMENLQTLKGIHFGHDDPWKPWFSLIPNIKKIGVTSGEPPCLTSLYKLESFQCQSSYVYLPTFPHSLKKLSLGSNLKVDGKLLLETIGALPLLEKLKLGRGKFKEWETREDQFPSLKYLELYCCDLQSWMTESSHFPRLERLHLYELKLLEEIPCEIGEIATMQSIVLEYCSGSAVESAKKITEEQEDIRVRVVLFNTEKNQALRSLASSNFVVETVDF